MLSKRFSSIPSMYACSSTFQTHYTARKPPIFFLLVSQLFTEAYGFSVMIILEMSNSHRLEWRELTQRRFLTSHCHYYTQELIDKLRQKKRIINICKVLRNLFLSYAGKEDGSWVYLPKVFSLPLPLSSLGSSGKGKVRPKAAIFLDQMCQHVSKCLLQVLFPLGKPHT